MTNDNSQYEEVTDPALLARLNASNQSIPNEVTDPALLARLNAPNQPAQSNSVPQGIEQTIGQYFPKPELPIGMSVVSGAMKSLLPHGEDNSHSFMMNLPQILTNATQGIPQHLAEGVGSSLISLLTGGTSKLGQATAGGVMGALQAPPGQGLQSGLTNALTTLGLGSALPYANKLFTAVKPKEVATEIQGAHDALSDKASQGFQDVSDAISQRGINYVPIWGEGIFKNIYKYFPKTDASKDLINAAQTGDFNALRKLQTDLWTRGTKGASSDLVAENNKAEEMFEKRDKINDLISKHLQSTGSHDLDNLLNQSRYDYYNLRNTYYNKNLNNSVKQLVEPTMRKVPNNLMDVLQEDSLPMNHLRNTLYTGSFEPGQNAIVDLPSAINAINARKAFGWKKLGVGAGGLYGAYKGFHKLHSNDLTATNYNSQNENE